MSRGALSSYSFQATIPNGQQSITVSLDAFIGAFAPPPESGFLRRIVVKSEAAALTGGNYDVAVWATDSAVALNRAMYEVIRRTGVVVAGGSAVATPDLNEALEEPYVLQTGLHTPDMQVNIDTGAAEAVDRDFRVILEIEGASSPDSPQLPTSQQFEANAF